MHLSGDIRQVIVLVTAILLVAAMFIEKLKPAVVFFVAALIFVLTGIVPVKEFLLCFSNPSILSIFLLIWITNSIREHFNLLGRIDIFFRKARTLRGFMWRMNSGVAIVSAFINNTPLVALMIPYVHAWARKRKIAPSRILMSLSFSAMLGGMITLIGTSTNLVLNGLITSKGDPGLQFTDFLFLGMLVSLGGILFMYFIGYRLLPIRKDMMDQITLPEFSATAHTNGPAPYFSHKPVHQRKPERLPALEIAGMTTGLGVMEPMAEDEAASRMVSGREQYNGNHFIGKNNDQNPDNCLLEAVIPIHSPLIGKSLKAAQFRQHYDAEVVSIHRRGEQIEKNIKSILLKAGDMLLLEAGDSFRDKVRSDHTLYPATLEEPPRQQAGRFQKRLFFVSLAAMIGLLVVGVISLFMGLLLLTTVLVLSKMLTISEMKNNLDVELLIILAASLTFSKALIDTGAAATVSYAIVSVFSGGGGRGLLIGTFILTLILTSFITHVATISIVFPIAYALCHGAGLDPIPFYVAIAFAASASFHSPFSYQTNLMVLGPGNYRFKDFIRAGLPLTVLYSAISIIFIIFYYKM